MTLVSMKGWGIPQKGLKTGDYEEAILRAIIE
jgi:hypothetical protein